MTLTELTISELDRLVRAVQATRPEDPAVVRQVVERMAADPTLRHGRMTIESVLNMLDAWNGSTVPPETAQPTVTAPAADLADPYQTTRALLGNNLITPEDIARRIGLPYTRQQLQTYAQELPSAEALQWCADRGYFLVAGPHVSLSVLEIFELFPDIFSEDSWRRYRQALIGGNLNLGVRWFAINIRPQQLLRGKTYSLQQKLVHPEYEQPAGMVATAWTIAMAKKVRDGGLDGSLRTKTTAGTGSHFIYQASSGVVLLNATLAENKSNDLGLAVICWPPPERR